MAFCNIFSLPKDTIYTEFITCKWNYFCKLMKPNHLCNYCNLYCHLYLQMSIMHQILYVIVFTMTSVLLIVLLLEHNGTTLNDHASKDQLIKQAQFAGFTRKYCKPPWNFRKTFSISRTISPNVNGSCFALQLSLSNPLKPGAKFRMKM